MRSILDFYARTHTPYLHALGQSGTAFLLQKMNPKPGQKLLEIGFGTGQTLLELICRFNGVEVYGMEKSPEMLRVAQQRFAFAGVDGSRFRAMPGSLDFPYPDGFFDVIYCESVLAILPDEDLAKIWSEASFLLRPGGSFFFNESLWREGVPLERINRINQQCLESFGIPQASSTWVYPSDWQALAETHRFRVLERIHLEGIQAQLPLQFDSRLLRSGLYSYWGKLKSWFLPDLCAEQKQIGQQIKLLAEEPPFLEGVFFHCQKI
jgi:ubiquinone/menaquinone biosynthesis C-methylase UbiE